MQTQDIGIRSVREGKFLSIVTSVPKSKKFVEFPITEVFCPAFSGMKKDRLPPKYEVLECIKLEMPVEGGAPKQTILGKIDLSQVDLQDVCPTKKDQRKEEEISVLMDDEVAEYVDGLVESSHSESEFDEEESSSRADSDDDYVEPTWQDLIEDCPDEFEYIRPAYRLVLRPDREKHTLILTQLTLFFNRKTRQSEPGKKILKKGKR